MSKTYEYLRHELLSRADLFNDLVQKYPHELDLFEADNKKISDLIGLLKKLRKDRKADK